MLILAKGYLYVIIVCRQTKEYIMNKVILESNINDDEIPESAFHYGDVAPELIIQEPIKREINWPLLYAYLFFMTTLGLSIHLFSM